MISTWRFLSAVFFPLMIWLLYVFLHRVGKQLVNIPSFMVRVDTEKHVDFSLTSPLGGGPAGRVKRKNQKKASGGGGDDGEEEED